MIVPRFWAEARLQQRTRRRQITIRRAGWSNESEAEAQIMAQARAEEAMAKAMAGQAISRWDRKAAYNGAEGMPIREEIIEERGETVMTRNSYGARCLNTPNVMFVDIDVDGSNRPLLLAVLAALVLICAPLTGWLFHSRMWAIAVLLAGYIAYPFVRWSLRKFRSPEDEPEQIAARRIRAFLLRNPEWNVRIYRTPAGFRLLTTHRTFIPDASTGDLMKELGADPIYILMCLNQRCFRARVSAKPWRAGIEKHIPSQGKAWVESSAARRKAWAETYEARAQEFAACRFLEEAGSGATDAAVQTVREWHDALCQAESELPLA